MLSRTPETRANAPIAPDREVLLRVAADIGQVLVGKPREIRMALACLLAGGHLLIEDLPGVGKTTLAHALASLLGLQYNRIQFTSDLLPADVVGVSIYERDKGTFRFQPGPVFAQVLLADEINRATPKAQSALLEAMEERQVTADGMSRALPEPFFVIATQNPAHQIGTYPLPESQLDRFLMRLSLGYPDATAERALLAGRDRRELLAELRPAVGAADVMGWQAQVRAVRVTDALLDYAQALLAHSRASAEFRGGLSPRAGLALLASARAWAVLEGRAFVIPEDVQAVLPPVVGHRLICADGGGDSARRLLEAVDVP